MSHVDPKRPTVMPAYPLGSPPGAELLDPDEDPQTAHPPAPAQQGDGDPHASPAMTG